eukprot:TRINITY_DN111703_c0_g1_i1.p1 TRINITY_DN111703_c0_g1~~TRINITY_DN111703_c0_g1_i1.p1  ORF type:complete len:254 (-),score=64.19 TRINITY_DN111703_c0_g1_i1:30-710(-)
MPHDLAKTPWNTMRNLEMAVVQENKGIDKLETLMKEKRDKARAKGEKGRATLLHAGSEVTLAGMRQRAELNGQRVEVLEKPDDDGFYLVRLLGETDRQKKTLRVQPFCLYEGKPPEQGAGRFFDPSAPAEPSALSLATVPPSSVLSRAAPESALLPSMVSSVAPPQRSKMTEFEAWSTGVQTKFATSPEFRAKSGPTGTFVGLEKIHTGTWQAGLPGKRLHGFAGF